MALYVLIAVLCVVPFASSMFLPHSFGTSFELGYDLPDTKIFRRNAFGQLQAYDVSTDQHFVRSPTGSISRYNVMEISSDPEVYTNTVGGGFGGLQNTLLSAMRGFGNSGIPGRGLGAAAAGLGASTSSLGATAANALAAAAGATGSSLNSLKMPLGMNTLNNYVGNYDPFSMMF